MSATSVTNGIEPTNTITIMTRPSDSPAPSPTSNSNNGGLQSGPLYLYAFVIISIIVILVIVLSAWRGRLVRRERLRLGLPVSPLGGANDSTVPQNPPVMYTVSVPYPYYTDGKNSDAYFHEDAEWDRTRPLSAVIMDIPPKRSQDSLLNVRVTTFSALKALLTPERFRRRATEKEKEADPSPQPAAERPQKVMTSVLVAMPSPSRHTPRSSRNLDEDDDVPLPEVSFGVYEGPWHGKSM